MTSKQEALNRLDALEQKVEKTVAENAQMRADAGELKKLLLANQELARAVDTKDAQIQSMYKRLQGYSELDKALGKIRGDAIDPEQVRKIVQEEVAKLPVGSNPTPEGVQINESVPYVDLKVSKPWLTLDESTLEGQITVLALGGKMPEKFVMPDVLKALEVGYSWKAGGGRERNRLKAALDALVGKYKTFERERQSNGQWAYWLRADARSRVKESETKEAVEGSA